MAHADGWDGALECTLPSAHSMRRSGICTRRRSAALVGLQPSRKTTRLPCSRARRVAWRGVDARPAHGPARRRHRTPPRRRSIGPAAGGSCGDDSRNGVAASWASSSCQPDRGPLDCRAPGSGGRVEVDATRTRFDVGHGIVVSSAISPIPRMARSPRAVLPGHHAAHRSLAGVPTLTNIADPNGTRRSRGATGVAVPEREDPLLSMCAWCSGPRRRRTLHG